MELFTEAVIIPRTVDDILSGSNNASGSSLSTPDNGSTDGGTTVGGTQIGGSTYGGAYYSNTQGARVEIFPEYDNTIGFASFDVDGVSVFKTIISGNDIGDVILGNYAGGQGAKWDQSAGTFSILGGISAGTIDIGGADATSFHVDADGNLWAGAVTYNIATNPFAVSNAGILRAVSGTIGGWTIGATTLSATGISLDAGNFRIGVGSSNEILIDGANKKIESSNYSSGVFGSGFHIDSNLLEVGNIAARGLIRTAVFQKDVVSTVGGNLAVLDGDVLDIDMTTLDSMTVTTKGNTKFSVGDILRIKDGIDDEWMEVTVMQGATSSQTKSPGTVVSDGSYGDVLWVNPNNVKVNDGVYSTCTLVNEYSDGLAVSNFGFTIPSNATITGFLIEIKCKTTSVEQELSVSELSYDGDGEGFSIGAVDQYYNITTTLNLDSYDSLNPTYINSSTFGLLILVNGGELDTGVTSIDHIQITVNYVIQNNIYTVTRDKASDYGADTNPTWKKGATIVNYGQSGDGGVYMTASESNAPYLSIFTHAGSPWTTQTTRVRLGNLNGFLSYSSDYYGIGIGESTKYLTYDSSFGLRVRGNITADSGYIGGSTGWSIQTGYIKKDGATDATSAGMAPADYPFYAGKKYADRATAPFRVTPAGVLTATSATITGTINATAGYFGSGSTRVAIESAGLNVGNTGSVRGGQTAYNTGDGFWLGWGTTTATSTAFMPPTDASADEWTNMPFAFVLNGKNAETAAGSLHSDAFSDFDFSDIPSTAVITGITINVVWKAKTTGTAKIKLNVNCGDYNDSETSVYYDECDCVAVPIETSSTSYVTTTIGSTSDDWNPVQREWRGGDFNGKNTTLVVNIWENNGGVIPAIDFIEMRITYSLSSTIVPKFSIGNSTNYMTWDGIGLNIRGTLNADDIVAGTLTGRMFQTHAGAESGIKIYTSDYLAGVSGYLEFWDNVGDAAVMYYYTDGSIQLEGADFYVNGDVGGDTKSFIIDHPLKENKYLRYVCPEFPEVLAMCRGTGKVKLPDHFEAITVPESIQIIQDKDNNNWIATGVRIGYEDFDCEPDINEKNKMTKRINKIKDK